jgi:hypothetical protein
MRHGIDDAAVEAYRGVRFVAESTSISPVKQADHRTMLGEGGRAGGAPVDVCLHRKALLGWESPQREGRQVSGPIAAGLAHG